MTAKISRFIYVIFYADIITIINKVYRILHIYSSYLSVTRLAQNDRFTPLVILSSTTWLMANEKDTIRQMTLIFDYILISEPVSLNTRPNLFVYPILTR